MSIFENEFDSEINLYGFEDVEIMRLAEGLDNQITAGIWNSAHKWKSFRSRQVHALLQRTVMMNRELSKRIDNLELALHQVTKSEDCTCIHCD